MFEDRNAIVQGPKNLRAYIGGDVVQASDLVIIFDEIHKYSRWKTFLKGFYDSYNGDCKILVAGSARLDVYKAGGG